MAQHGGRRKGAGRKSGSGKYGEPTQPMRIPKSLVAEVQKLIDRKIQHSPRIR